MHGRARIAEKEHGLVLALDENGLMPPSVPDAWKEFESFEWFAFSIMQLHLRRDGVEVRAKVSLRHRALVRERVLPLLALHMDTRVWEGTHKLGTNLASQPRSMVEVQVREDDMCDGVRGGTVFAQRVHDCAWSKLIHGALLLAPLVTITRFDEHEAIACVDEQRPGRERNAVLLIRSEPLRPHGLWDESEHSATIEAKSTSLERGNACDSQGTQWYDGKPAIWITRVSVEVISQPVLA